MNNPGNRWPDLQATLICRLVRQISTVPQVGRLEEAERSLRSELRLQMRKRSPWLWHRRNWTHTQSRLDQDHRETLTQLQHTVSGPGGIWVSTSVMYVEVRGRSNNLKWVYDIRIPTRVSPDERW